MYKRNVKECKKFKKNTEDSKMERMKNPPVYLARLNDYFYFILKQT